MKELINVEKRNVGNGEINTIDARELWKFLNSGKDFSTWVKNKIIDNPFFIENEDWIRLPQTGEAQPCGSQPLSANRKDYALTINTAKKVVMSEQTATGDEVRNYFIEVEKKYKSSVQVLPDFSNPAEAARAWALEYEQKQIALKTIEEQNKKIAMDEPKVDSYNKYMNTSGLHNLTDACKLAGLRPRKAIEVLINKGLLYRKGKTILPYQKCVDDGRFVIKQGVSGDDFAYSQVFVTKHGLAFLWKNKNILENCY